jgi:uncharacterized repeat protein (TIGR04076 family)
MPWKAFIDGGSRGNPGPAGAGIQISDHTGKVVFAGGFFLGNTTNNQAEYQSLLKVLDLFEKAGAQDIAVFTDSELMVRQINNQYAVKSKPLKNLYNQAQQKLEAFDQWEVQYIPRSQNRQADKLVNRTLNAGREVIVTDILGLVGRKIDRPKSVSPTGPAIVEVFVLKSPAKQSCPANMKRGQLFIFDKMAPAGFCTHACAAVVEVVLALQEEKTTDSSMTVRCPKDDCGAVFEIRHPAN